mmetsp:Transcript_127976/g.190657  ORF Transcript_127976/g.190657 Transcript_127976/m.190657 type:complete len:195 (+) Transcript_127976:26-610(+)
MAMRSLLLSLALVALPSTLAFSSVNSVSALRLSTVSSFKTTSPSLKRCAPRVAALRMADEEKPEAEESKINPWLSLNTRGGALVWTTVLLVLPAVFYSPLASFVGDEAKAGRIIAGIYSLGVLVLWTGSYVFRVGTKDMTYGKQLKAYEDAVIAKRFEELQEDEVEALLSDLDLPNDQPPPPKIRGSGWRPDQY